MTVRLTLLVDQIIRKLVLHQAAGGCAR